MRPVRRDVTSRDSNMNNTCWHMKVGLKHVPVTIGIHCQLQQSQVSWQVSRAISLETFIADLNLVVWSSRSPASKVTGKRLGRTAVMPQTR